LHKDSLQRTLALSHLQSGEVSPRLYTLAPSAYSPYTYTQIGAACYEQLASHWHARHHCKEEKITKLLGKPGLDDFGERKAYEVGYFIKHTKHRHSYREEVVAVSNTKQLGHADGLRTQL